MLPRSLGRGEEQVRDRIRDHPVDLFGHHPIKTYEASLHMTDQMGSFAAASAPANPFPRMITILPGLEDVQFHCHKRTGKHRIRIALHQHDVGRFLFEHTPDTRQDPVGFGKWGFDLLCWLSRVLESPAGSTDLLRL